MAPVAVPPPGTAILLATIDPYGWAHPALVSYAEIVAFDAARLRLALHVGSRSSRHLRESGRATLVFADAELCLYVKAEALVLPGARARRTSRGSSSWYATCSRTARRARRRGHGCRPG